MHPPSWSRREWLALLATAPFAARLGAQTNRVRRVTAAYGGATYLLEADGSIKVWSSQTTFGAYLGLGTPPDERVAPYTVYSVPGLRDVVQVVGTIYSGYALTADGRIFSWGGNTRGQLGTTPRSEVETLASANGNKSAPTPVVNVPKAVAISAAGYHALALTAEGTVFTWGYNVNDELGLDPMPIIQYKNRPPGAMQYLPFPMQIPSLKGVKAIAAGGEHSLALLSDGTVMGWGPNRFGEVGDGTTELRKTPVPVVGVRNAVGVAAGSRISAAWLADGTVMTWGFGNMGLGRKTIERDTPYPTPTRVEGVADVRDVAIGSIHMVALTASGNVITWGDQQVGEVGHGPAPARLPALTNVHSITATTGSTMCVLTNGTIMVLGNVSDRQSSGGGRAGYARAPIALEVTGLKNPL